MLVPDPLLNMVMVLLMRVPVFELLVIFNGMLMYMSLLVSVPEQSKTSPAWTLGLLMYPLVLK